MPDVVAIDGPAGAGKSTIARLVAEDLGWAYLDTGAMYRAATLRALEAGVPLDGSGSLAHLVRGLDLTLAPDGRVRVGGRDVTSGLRTDAVDRAVSHVASVPEVRAVMVLHQRRYAEQNGRIVAEGRDIGTVVFPDARVKIFLDADPGERARRRLGQGRPEEPSRADLVERTRADLEARDTLDRTRSVAPLRPAEDAWLLDTTGMTLQEVFAAVRSHVRSRIPVGPDPDSVPAG